jgi:Uma2 family endonuclease
MPHLKHAELIEGVVYVPSPVCHLEHGKPHSLMMIWLGSYFAATPGVDISDNATVRLDSAHTDLNEPQPDALLRLEPSAGGTSRVGPDGYIEGAPELIAEIAASSAAYDLHDKKDAYQRCGVQEYLVWQVYDRRIDWWELREGVYQPLPADEQGIVASRVFPGLWLQRAALLAGDMATVLAVVQQGVGTPQHMAFVARLRSEEGARRE